MSDYLDPNNEELLKDFFSEAQMQVDTLEQNILVLENEGGNKDSVDEIFRAAHTLKGGSATVEMMELSHFTHLVEDVLDAIRSDQLAVNEDVVDVLLSAIDVIKAMLGKRMEGMVYQEDTSEIEVKLSALLPEGAKNKRGSAPRPVAKAPAAKAPAPQEPKPAAPAPESPAPQAGGLTDDDLRELRESVAGNAPIYRISVKFDESSLMNTVGGIQVYAALKGEGTVLRTTPDFEALYEDNFFPVVDYYYTSSKPAEEIRKYVIIPDVSLDATVTDISKVPAGQAVAPAPKPAAPKPAAPQAAPPAQTPAAPAAQTPAEAAAKLASAANSAEEAKKAGKEAGSILRVDSKRIDDLLNLVSETVITKATFNQISNQFNDMLVDLHDLENKYREKIKSLFDKLPDYLDSIQEGRSVKDIRKEIGEEYGDMFTIFDGFEASVKTNMGKFRSTSQNLGRITGELQEGVMRIRKVPISQIFSRFPRLVRDLSKSLNKKINLVIEGEETELDKSVIEDLLDPIMHSVRNSIDHGIESQ
jgi:two-component system chemotaxis sensor kinase CheA